MGYSSATPIGVSRQREFFPELESLRGIAVLLVFLVHIDDNVHRLALPWPGTVSLPWAFVRHGRTGVDIFFVLSGFLLSLPFVEALREGRPVAIRAYLARRALRILPLYWTAVLLATVVTATALGDLLRGVPPLFFLNSFGRFIPSMQPYSLVWWSVATEVQFYLALALFALLLQSRARWLAAVIMAVWVIAYGCYLAGPRRLAYVDEVALQCSLFCRLPLFLAGVGAAVLYERHGLQLRRWAAEQRWFRNGGADAFLLLELAAIGVFLQWMLRFGTRTYEPAYQASDLVMAAGWGTVLLVLILAPLRTKCAFSNRALARIGVVSYSIFLLHNPVIVLGLRWIRGTWAIPVRGPSVTTVLVAAGLGIACYALAELTFRTIEAPFLARKARLDAAPDVASVGAPLSA